MSDSKEYVSRSDELGNIHISEEVLAAISAAAALEVDGVSSLAANLGSDIAELLGKKNLAKGVRVRMEDDKVVVELSVLMTYGHTIPEMCRAVQEGVKNAVESMTGLEVSAVNVNVGGITFPPPQNIRKSRCSESGRSGRSRFSQSKKPRDFFDWLHNAVTFVPLRGTKVPAARAARPAQQGVRGIRFHSRRAAAPSSSPATTAPCYFESRFLTS